ncbi:hypothetical protein VP01_637g19 [Puccinia sorghi]|uniref:Uncharacterized protein n=1 Tax=Puccinia sorghi TaxID=27349 RepID=A0A0L6UG17_9BASI|nr:hypothetical protein VP01_637g19 [Puccinia sorghi]
MRIYSSRVRKLTCIQHAYITIQSSTLILYMCLCLITLLDCSTSELVTPKPYKYLNFCHSTPHSASSLVQKSCYQTPLERKRSKKPNKINMWQPMTSATHSSLTSQQQQELLEPDLSQILQTLQEFYQKFTKNKQINQAVKMSSSHALINSNEVQLFEDTTQGSIKLGRQIIHVGCNNICYAYGLMVHLGLRTWCSNLEEDSASLYNAAH